MGQGMQGVHNLSGGFVFYLGDKIKYLSKQIQKRHFEK